MKYLFLFLKKQLFFILFVFLELIAFLLLANNNNYHRSNIVNTSNVITGSFYSGFSSISDYFSLKSENNMLLEENTFLRNSLAIQNEQHDSLLIDDGIYEFIPAGVISNTNRSRNNFIMINKGRKDGIEKEMGVISSLGAAGIIVEVSEHYATAISILHKDTRISAKLKKNGQMLNVVWDGKEYKSGMVEDIPSHIFPSEGDTVVTSGYSFIFPENIMIGTISGNVIRGGNFNKARLLFSTDFNRLHNVYVTKNLASKELDSLLILPGDE